MTTVENPTDIRFADLGLHPAVLQALGDVGYESPSPIQAETIPHLLAGRDVLGQAQTGTGKTAAFALPILSGLDLGQKKPQALVLCPTRELAIQVAEAFHKYAAHLEGFHVLPVYGGQSYTPQLQSLKRGVHVVVGTPGRVMDHLKRGTLDLSGLTNLVLDEADEMLRMGFIDDVEWILEQTPEQRQVALFSATMPNEVRRIARTHLKNPAEVTIRGRTSTATSIRQRYWIVGGMQSKLDSLTRLLEAEPFDAMLVFVRTRQATIELTEKLEARGFPVEALNGDIPQNVRERTIQRIKGGQIDIVVATDVAARGLDVERISHVVNFDVPYDPESYVHRIGRTGRAGRSGEAILFIAPRERNMLRIIERATRQPIEHMQMPTVEAVNQQRIARFKERITDMIAGGEAQRLRFVVEQYERETGTPPLDIAAALACMAQGKAPLLLEAERSELPRQSGHQNERKSDFKGDRTAGSAKPEGSRPGRNRRRESLLDLVSGDNDMSDAPARGGRDDIRRETFRIEVGHVHGVKPGNIVGAIANEAGLEGHYIGRVDIRDDHSFVDLPEGMPREIFRDLKKTRVAGQALRISRADASPPGPAHFKSGREGKPDRPEPHRAPGAPGEKSSEATGKPPGKHRKRRGP